METTTKSYFSHVFDECKLSVERHGYVITDDKWGQYVVQSPWTKIYFALDGAAEFITETEKIKIEPGYVYVAPCAVAYGYKSKPSVTHLFFNVNVTLPDGQDLFFAPNMRIVRFKRDMEKLQQLKEWYFSDDAIKQTLVKIELWQAIKEAILELGRESKNTNYSKVVFEAINYIRANLSATLKIEKVAEAVFCSAATLNRRFKKETNSTVAKYIEWLCMMEAKRRLGVETDKNIGEISADLGFCDQFYFSRRFEKTFSITPRKYRKLLTETKLS